MIVLLLAVVGHTDGDGVAARGGVGGLDLGRRAFPDELASSVAGVPDIGERVLGIEVAGRNGSRDGFPYHDFIGLHGTGGSRGYLAGGM